MKTSVFVRRHARSMRPVGITATCVLLVFQATPPLAAADIYWNVSSGNWGTEANWNPQQVPTGSDDAHLERSGGGVAQITSGIARADDLYISNNNQLQITGGTLDMSENGKQQFVGYADASTGTILQTGGSNILGYLLYLGHGNNSTGNYTMTAGTLNVDNGIRVGNGGNATGILNQFGGSITLNGGRIEIGYGAGSKGTYRLSGNGTVTVNGTYGIDVGDSDADGRFEWFRQGGVTVNRILMSERGTLAIGYDFNAVPGIVQNLANATLEVTNNATVTKNDYVVSAVKNLRIGSATGPGFGVMSNGTVAVNQTIWIGDAGLGTVTQSGGNMSAGSHLYLGYAGGNGTYILTSGTVNLGASNVFVGRSDAPDGSTGRLVLRGGSMNVNNVFMPYANNTNSSGTLVLDGGSLNNSGATLRVTNLILGEEAGRSGSYTLGPGKTMTATTMKVGDAGSGSFTQTSGNATVGTLYLGAQAGGVGTYYLQGGTLQVTGQVIDGAGNGTLQIDGGTFSPTNNVQVDALKIGIATSGTHTQTSHTCTVSQLTLGSGIYHLRGGTLQTGTVVNASGGGQLNIDGGTFVPSGNIDVDALRVGIANPGSHQQTAHTYTVGSLTLGAGNYTLSGGSLVAGNVTNTSGSGALILDGGTFAPGGNVDVDTLVIGRNGTVSYTVANQWQVGSLLLGQFNGASGALTLPAGTTLVVGANIETGTGQGHLTLNGGSLQLTGQLGVTGLVVGANATAQHIQSGKTYTIANDLVVGSGSGSGTYRLENSAVLTVGNTLLIGSAGGTGRFEWYQSGGLSAANGIALGAGSTLAMGADFDADALAGNVSGMISGLHQATWEITRNATGIQDAETVTVKNLQLGAADGAGTYRLSGSGQLTVSSGGQLAIGPAGGAGRLEWFRDGGLSAPAMVLAPGSTLAMGANFSAEALVSGTLSGGTLTGLNMATLEVTNNASANHGGGEVKVQTLKIGAANGSGSWRISGGDLKTEFLTVGQGADGALHLDGGQVIVSKELTFGPRSRLSAQPGTTIHLTGTAVKNLSKKPADLADLVNVTFSFEPEGVISTSTVEVAGEDRGVSMAGFDTNFAFDGLSIGWMGNPALVKLVDESRNHNEPMSEVLYVHSLFIGSGSILDLNNIKVYYDQELQNQGNIINGTPIFIPEPGTLGLLACSLLIRLRRRRHK